MLPLKYGKPFSKTVVVVCVVVFVLMLLDNDYIVPKYLLFFLSWEHATDLTQAWRWITPVLLHFGVFHLLFNMMWWWDYGNMVEICHGTPRLILVFVASGLLSNAAQFAMDGPAFGGLSGVVFGVLSYCWVYGRLIAGSPVTMPTPIYAMMLVWMLIGFWGVLDSVLGPMANYAHLAGALAGVVLGVLFALRERGNVSHA